MSSDIRKLAMMMFLTEERGVDNSVAGRAALATLPLDDSVQPGRAFEKAARKQAKQFAKASKNANPSELDRLATATLHEIRALAVEHGEGYYAQRYEQALST
jgi:hypothetical protein